MDKLNTLKRLLQRDSGRRAILKVPTFLSIMDNTCKNVCTCIYIIHSDLVVHGMLPLVPLQILTGFVKNRFQTKIYLWSIHSS